MSSSYYDILEVDSTADTQTIRKAYVSKARTWHPDNFGDSPPPEAQKQMQLLNEAWQCLRHTETRASYDLQQRAQSHTQIRVTENFSTVQNLAERRQKQEQYAAQLQKKSFRKLLLFTVSIAAIALLALSIFTPDVTTSEPKRTVPANINIGANIALGDCVSVNTGPSLLEVPCDANATGRVFSAGTQCSPAVREVTLQNDVVVCLVPI